MNEAGRVRETETERFLRWYESAKAKGLVDIKFYPGDVSRASSEEFFGDVNALIDAIDKGVVVSRPDVF